MARDGHVKVQRGGRILLTAKGRKVAQHLSLRHQLAEMLLTEVIGLSWAKAHAEAERMEHAISPEVEALLDRSASRDTKPVLMAFRCAADLPSFARKARSFFPNCNFTIPPKLFVSTKRKRVSSNFSRTFIFALPQKSKSAKREYDETMTLRAAGHTMHLGKPATSRIRVRRLAA